MSIRIVRLGTARVEGEGTRIGTVRRPPRGVPKARFAADDWYDTWLPELSPSVELVDRARKSTFDADFARFMKEFRKEMSAPQAVHLIDLLVALSRYSNFSIGCYCEVESRCHRSVLRALLLERDAEVI
jgi:uncharacterized protein YeaO (DUF488 family)